MVELVGPQTSDLISVSVAAAAIIRAMEAGPPSVVEAAAALLSRMRVNGPTSGNAG